MTTFPESYRHAEVEPRLRELWAGSDVFKWDPQAPPESDFVIDTPPPTVSGALHIGHVYSYTQADIVARYFRMRGRNVLYPIGWDDNGLPTERLVEKVRKVRGGTMAREAFVEMCREVIVSYEDAFRDLFSRLALSVDWSRQYQTISDESQAISQLSFLDLYHKGLLERRLEPTLWDPADRTAIAQAEVEDIEREGQLNYIPFGVEGAEPAVIATTRPELLGACAALMIHPSHPRSGQLVGRSAVSPLFRVPVPIIADEAVDPEKGTGIVMCCTFGDTTDIQWWRRHGLPLRLVVDKAGRMLGDIPIGTDSWPTLDAGAAAASLERIKGLKIDQARAAILEMLREQDLVLKQETTQQVVPVAERSRAPLEIIVTPQWFVRTLDFREEILAKGREIEWRPDYMRQRFESWVEGLKWDWAISRQRHFGVPIPVWYSKRPGEEDRILVAEPGQLPVDPTRDLPPGYGEDEVVRETDVMDTWATSSVSPQLITRTINEDYGFDIETHRRLFPMALRPQAHEIIRTWAFYTIVKALHHEQTLPWRTIAISGWCLASDGSKMSKSRGNVVDPIKLLDEYGSDAVRYWTGTSRLGNDTVLSVNTLKQGKRLATKLWNAARLAHLALEQAAIRPVSARADVADGTIRHPLDQWLLGQLARVVGEATEAFEAYEYSRALRITEDFFWRTHCDNYLEIVKARTRFEGEPSAGQRSALHTLHHATRTILRLFAPFMPYITEALDALLGDREGRQANIHARGQWPSLEDQVDASLNHEIGDPFVELVAAARKVKSDLAVSLRAPVTMLTVSPEEGQSLDELQALVARVGEDLKTILTAEALTCAPACPAGLPSGLSPNRRFRVALALAPPAPAD